MPGPSHFLDPALLLLIGLGIGLALGSRGALANPRRRVRIGAAIGWTAWALAWLLTSPWFAARLARAVEAPPTDLGAALAGTDPARRALVVLSGGMKPAGHGATLVERLYGDTTERLIGAAGIYHAYGFGHVVVTGASLHDEPEDAMAEAMAQFLVALGVPKDRIHLESHALDTKQNAALSAAILRGLPVDHVVVVTSALHMRRSVWEFGRSGLTVIPAPVDYEPPAGSGLDAVLPSSGALALSHRCLHELLGRLKP